METDSVKNKVISCELAGIKYLKTSKQYRLELDIKDIDKHKVKDLIEQVGEDFMIAFIHNKDLDTEA